MINETYLRDVDIAARFRINRCTVWRWAAAGKFPQPLKLTSACVRWREADVDDWIRRRSLGGDQ